MELDEATGLAPEIHQPTSIRMEIPILERLKAGEKFDFPTLAENVDQTQRFWDWWWQTKVRGEVIERPEIIADNDPILDLTISKPLVEFNRYPEFFHHFLQRAIKAGCLPASGKLPRAQFGEALKQHMMGSSVYLGTRPQLVFAGGGYGSGKTTILNFLAHEERLPVEMRHMVGVDVFKPLVPEYNLITAVGDGRASLTVQAECQQIASDLFEIFVESRRSFIWDSSMSDAAATEARIQQARDEGYELTMIAVLTPLEVAIRQAMGRAQDSHRFPNPVALPKSHVDFRAAFHSYVPLFDEVIVFANQGGGTDNCSVIAEKTAEMNQLAIHDKELFRSALAAPKTA